MVRAARINVRSANGPVYTCVRIHSRVTRALKQPQEGVPAKSWSDVAVVESVKKIVAALSRSNVMRERLYALQKGAGDPLVQCHASAVYSSSAAHSYSLLR